eukprot:Protomagalhaensia_sp_Gyna_25__1650@NODE_1857_length_1468_cov_16_625612_g1526_i0_p1_GENE_NODE_1857_length_1468_cov_16_625612_g1526_i0NODE_1857_length_1468_cov_16_625612_g1526_i0_p1_ORF_typecomplete_len481_score45_11LCM/PF04072_14/6_5e33_NODE_1857_length_1468_cov_16_625612_g1526_i0261423
MATTNDSTTSKMSAVVKGYYKDSAIAFFAKVPLERRSPLINRGYYARVIALRSIICDFLEALEAGQHNTEYQLVNIGAGFDPLYYWLMEELESGPYSFVKPQNLRYFEADFPVILSQKTQVIDQNVLLQRTIRHYESSEDSNIIDSHGFLASTTWRMLPCDIRDLGTLDELALACGLRKDKPSLFLAECVLAYLKPAEADSVIAWTARFVETAPVCFVNYDPFQPNDRFGRMMVENLKIRNCPLLSVHEYPALADLSNRFGAKGFQDVSIQDMDFVYRNCLDRGDLLRIEQLELFDEVEEWRLIQGHYYIAVCLRKAMNCQSFQSLVALEQYWTTAARSDPAPRFTTKECGRASHFQLLGEAASRLLAVKNSSQGRSGLRSGFTRNALSVSEGPTWFSQGSALALQDSWIPLQKSQSAALTLLQVPQRFQTSASTEAGKDKVESIPTPPSDENRPSANQDASQHK